MSKRRINKQQQARIQKIQANYLDDSNIDSALNQEGLVLTRFSRHAEIETLDGKKVRCAIRPHIDSLVAGDKVIWQYQGPSHGIVLSRHPRQSMLCRPDKRGNERVVAANITQLVIVVAVKPELSLPLLDSYLIVAEHLQLDACILLNKVDYPCDPLKQTLQALYTPLGYPLIFTSQIQHQGYEQLQERLTNHTSVFVGQSGVGKSSLISTILPHEPTIQTAAISTQSELGCHTTSNSRLYHLPAGGALIDSPGVREFGLWKMSPAEIVYGFKEFRPLSAQCKFRNCNHQDALGCAIIAHVSENQPSLQRYNSLLKIIAESKPALWK